MRFIVREMRSIAYSLRHHDSHSSPRTNFSGTSAASENSEGIFDSGIAQLQKKDVDGAITDLSRAIDLNPRYVEAFFIRGQCLFLKRDLVGTRTKGGSERGFHQERRTESRTPLRNRTTPEYYVLSASGYPVNQIPKSKSAVIPHSMRPSQRTFSINFGAR
jgi:hypothetical protein